MTETHTLKSAMDTVIILTSVDLFQLHCAKITRLERVFGNDSMIICSHFFMKTYARALIRTASPMHMFFVWSNGYTRIITKYSS